MPCWQLTMCVHSCKLRAVSECRWASWQCMAQARLWAIPSRLVHWLALWLALWAAMQAQQTPAQGFSSAPTRCAAHKRDYRCTGTPWSGRPAFSSRRAFNSWLASHAAVNGLQPALCCHAELLQPHRGHSWHHRRPARAGRSRQAHTLLFGRHRISAEPDAAMQSCYGHTEGTAGITGALLALGALSRHSAPPVVNLRQINPHVEVAFADWRKRAGSCVALPRQQGPRLGSQVSLAQ